MKKPITILFAFVVCLGLTGLSSNSKDKYTDNTNHDPYKQKIIIMDSIYEPLPKEVKPMQTMPTHPDPQRIPNADLDQPIVITKMPYSEEAEKP